MGIFGFLFDVWDMGASAIREEEEKKYYKEKRKKEKLKQAHDDKEAEKNKLLRDLQIKKLQAEVGVTPQAKKKSAVKKYNPTLFNRQKREINRKLSEGLITDRTAKIQMNKAIADEKMRLIIENQRKEKKVKPTTNPKKPASTSTKEFEYVEKLKEIKSLREEGAITQAEFKKLKEKIIDSI